MVAKSLIKLTDEAIIPTLALIVAKMVGLYLTSLTFNLPFEVKTQGFLNILPAISFNNIADYTIAENYSNLAMLIVAALGTFFVLVRARFFHASHIHPKLHARLVRLNLESLIAPSYHLYHQAAIWLIFLWLTVGFLILSSILGTAYVQIAIIAFVVAANFSWIFALDIEKEVEISRESV
ncbi:MAG: hypothetical protein UU34_C0021G0009 [Candidatus Curtissbacteria bacterium GW2011_GWA1_41_11]|uniref:Uncharacterized protein n=1 Tax=Candidatus Curtissbacteria bacterium GW2011_GWA1_41_11 TaxID=1618409 RepID=A0A0G0WNW0_9BACT|nr:MAG: hypothetical protein UU34_C0021G0009 [Candidatus Curtissbacteria bacterium GW2011_GWA1_41_11]